jgi:hypothetical protein
MTERVVKNIGNVTSAIVIGTMLGGCGVEAIGSINQGAATPETAPATAKPTVEVLSSATDNSVEMSMAKTLCQQEVGEFTGVDILKVASTTNNEEFAYVFCYTKEGTKVAAYLTKTAGEAQKQAKVNLPAVFETTEKDGVETVKSLGIVMKDANGKETFVKIIEKSNDGKTTVYDQNGIPSFPLPSEMPGLNSFLDKASVVQAEAPIETPTTVPTETATATTAPTETVTATPAPEVSIGLPETYDQVKTVQEKDLPQYLDKLNQELWSKWEKEGSKQNFFVALPAKVNGVDVSSPMRIYYRDKIGQTEIWSWTKIIKEDGTQVDLIGVPYTKGVVFLWYNEQQIANYWSGVEMSPVFGSRAIFDDLKQGKLDEIVISVLWDYSQGLFDPAAAGYVVPQTEEGNLRKSLQSGDPAVLEKDKPIVLDMSLVMFMTLDGKEIKN